MGSCPQDVSSLTTQGMDRYHCYKTMLLRDALDQLSKLFQLGSCCHQSLLGEDREIVLGAVWWVLEAGTDFPEG